MCIHSCSFIYPTISNTEISGESSLCLTIPHDLCNDVRGLDIEELQSFIEANKDITCVCFIVHNCSFAPIILLCTAVKNLSNLKTAICTELDAIPIEVLTNTRVIDYLKIEGNRLFRVNNTLPILTELT